MLVAICNIFYQLKTVFERCSKTSTEVFLRFTTPYKPVDPIIDAKVLLQPGCHVYIPAPTITNTSMNASYYEVRVLEMWFYIYLCKVKRFNRAWQTNMEPVWGKHPFLTSSHSFCSRTNKNSPLYLNKNWISCPNIAEHTNSIVADNKQMWIPSWKQYRSTKFNSVYCDPRKYFPQLGLHICWWYFLESQ